MKPLMLLVYIFKTQIFLDEIKISLVVFGQKNVK